MEVQRRGTIRAPREAGPGRGVRSISLICSHGARRRPVLPAERPLLTRRQRRHAKGSQKGCELRPYGPSQNPIPANRPRHVDSSGNRAPAGPHWRWVSQRRIPFDHRAGGSPQPIGRTAPKRPRSRPAVGAAPDRHSNCNWAWRFREMPPMRKFLAFGFLIAVIVAAGTGSRGRSPSTPAAEPTCRGRSLSAWLTNALPDPEARGRRRRTPCSRSDRPPSPNWPKTCGRATTKRAAPRSTSCVKWDRPPVRACPH